MSISARVMRLWWNVDLLSFLQIITIAAIFPASPTTPTVGKDTLYKDTMYKLVMFSRTEEEHEQLEGVCSSSMSYKPSLTLSRRKLSWIGGHPASNRSRTQHPCQQLSLHQILDRLIRSNMDI